MKLKASLFIFSMGVGMTIIGAISQESAVVILGGVVVGVGLSFINRCLK